MRWSPRDRYKLTRLIGMWLIRFFLIVTFILLDIKSVGVYMTFNIDRTLFHGAMILVNKPTEHSVSLSLLASHSSLFFQTDRNWVVFGKFTILGMRIKFQQCDLNFQQPVSDTSSHITRCHKLLNLSLTYSHMRKRENKGCFLSTAATWNSIIQSIENVAQICVMCSWPK